MALPICAEVPQLDAGSNLMLRSPDMQFALRLSQSAGGAAALGHEAGSRSKNPEIQSLARQIADSYLAMRTNLASLVQPLRVMLPEEVPANELSVLIKLQNLPVNRIDRTYLKAEVKQLRRNLKAANREVKKGKNPQLQQFAAGVMPVLGAHLDKAHALYQTVAKTK